MSAANRNPRPPKAGSLGGVNLRPGPAHESGYADYPWPAIRTDEAGLCVIAADQNSTCGPFHESSRGRARARAWPASHQPSHALRPGRRRSTFSIPLHFA